MSLSKPSKGTKWKGHYDESRRFKPEWQRKYPWVKKAVDGSDMAYCSFCRINIQPRASNLKQHEETSKHVKITSSVSSSRKLFAQKPKDDEETKKLEIQFSVAIACHSAIMSIDHLGEIIVRGGTGSKLEKMKLHRTKCASLIKNVVSPALHEDLCKDMAGGKFCVMIDESTDVACLKYLCVAERFYSKVEKKIVTAFVGLIPVVSATGKDLFDAMKASVEAAGLKMSDCVGFGSDGASAMVGEYDSVWSRVRNESPNCTIMKCICHSLALCIKHAFEQMPSHLGFLLSEIPKWFSKSILRREAYKKLFDIINENSESASLPRPFQKFSQTRWLVRGKVIFNILVNWHELRAYFSVAELEGDAQVRYKARLIADMLRDPLNLLYFHFLSPIVAEFERMNAFFQATDIDPHDMIKELSLFFDSLKSRVVDVNGAQLPLAEVDFGAKFLFEANALVDRNKGDNSVLLKVMEAKGRCHKMLLEATSQVSKRLPPSRDVFQALSYLHPSRVLSQIGRVPLAKLPMQHLMADKLSEIDNQYRNIFLVNWREEPVFKDGIPQEAVPFWSGVLHYQNSVQEFPFADLAAYALACLTTPTSNAVVERIFSYVTNVKTKQRNRMGVTMLESLVRIRTHLHFGDKVFATSQRMLSLFSSDIMYPTSSAVSNNDEGDEIALVDFV